MEGILSTYNGKPLRFVWTYRAKDGAPFGVVARYDDGAGKSVVPYFKRNGAGWEPGGADEPRPLYGLDWLTRLPDGKAVLVVEGEKAAAALHSLGIVAITSPGGSKAASKADWTQLSGIAKAYLLPDNDEPGETYVRDVCAALGGLQTPPNLSLVRLPGLPGAGDVVDWLQARCPGWDGFAPIPEGERERLARELRQTVKECAEPMPQGWGRVEMEGAEDWPAPIPLDAALLPEWPRDVFPEPLGGFTNALMESTETPPELAALMVLAVLGTAAQGKYRVRVEPDYFEPVNIWTVCALPPGSRKTAVQMAATAPLSAWEREQRAALAEAIAKATSERETLQARINKLRAKAAGLDDKGAFRAMMEEIKDLEAELPEAPAIPQLWTEDVTPENLATIMAANQECMGILSDEGGIFAIIGGRYSRGMPNMDVFLKGHIGSPVRVNRGSRPPVFLNHPAISFGLTVQPELLRGLTECRDNRGRGLLARFLYALPPSNLGFRKLDSRPLSEDWKLRYAGIICAILNRPCPVNDEGDPLAHVLKLNAAAFNAWKVFQREVETDMREGGRFEYVTDWAGKLPGAVARIAALLHIGRYALLEPEGRDISAEDMEAAIRMGQALSAHALAAFDVMGADPALEGARAVLRWIERERVESFTFRDCHYRHKTRFKRVSDLEPLLEVLMERHLIHRRVTHGKPPHRPSRTFDVNPAIFST